MTSIAHRGQADLGAAIIDDLDRVQGKFEVGDEVGLVFDTDGQADQVVGNFKR